MGNSFGEIDDVTFSSKKQLSATIYLDFTSFDQKCFIGRAMKVRRRNVARRNEKPQHAKGVSRLFRTYQNMGFLPKRPYHTAVVAIVASAKENHRYQYLMSDFALAGLLRANAGHSEGRPACPTKLLDIPNLIFSGLRSQSFERNSEHSYHVYRDDPF